MGFHAKTRPWVEYLLELNFKLSVISRCKPCPPRCKLDKSVDDTGRGGASNK